MEQANTDTNLYRMAELEGEIRKLRGELAQARSEIDVLANDSAEGHLGLVAVMDHYERACNYLQDMPVSKGEIGRQQGIFLRGLFLALDAARNELRKRGVEQIIPERGSPYDPETMDAIQAQPVVGIPHKQVGLCYEAGYRKKEWLIRPARVLCWIPT